MESFEDRNLRPLLRILRLKKASFSTELVDKQTFRFRLDRQVTIELEDPTKVEEKRSSDLVASESEQAATKAHSAPRGFVEIDLSAHFVDSENNTVEGVTAAAIYRASFDFNKDAQPSEIAKAMEVEAYQYLFVAQAFPLAVRHFKEQLAAMGINSKDLPLGIT